MATRTRALRWTDGHMRTLLDGFGWHNRGQHLTSAELARALETFGVDPYKPAPTRDEDKDDDR